MSSQLSPPTEECVSIPENAVHAVSVSLPLWKHNVAYEEGDPELSRKMKSGYPRFKIHYKIEELVETVEKNYGREGEKAMIFATYNAAGRCREFIRIRHPDASVRVLRLCCPKTCENNYEVNIAVVFFPADLFSVAKQYWQHTGEGISSRQAQYFQDRLDEENNTVKAPEAPTPAQESLPSLATPPQEIFVEERFGRYLSSRLANEAKPALKKRIAMEVKRRGHEKVTSDDIFLYQCGMAAIYSSYRAVMELKKTKETGLKAVCFGFPYTDTLKILQKWGPGCEFFPIGDENDLNSLATRLDSGELKISALFCEVPSNPLLKTPDTRRIRELATKHDFLVVIDDTVGNIANIDCLKPADICVSSLTKVFSGDCNVMAGDMVLNPEGAHYEELVKIVKDQHEASLWAEDAIYLERNSRDFYDRNQRINSNAETVVNVLLDYQKNHPAKLIKDVNYPKCVPSKRYYDDIKFADGGYGGLLSVVFNNPKAAIAFYDTLFIAKGPSLGTNFTLGCPYTIIAHYNELEFVNSCGVDTHLVRISIGLEEKDDLIQRFKVALDAAEHAAC